MRQFSSLTWQRKLMQGVGLFVDFAIAHREAGVGPGGKRTREHRDRTNSVQRRLRDGNREAPQEREEPTGECHMRATPVCPCIPCLVTYAASRYWCRRPTRPFGRRAARRDPVRWRHRYAAPPDPTARKRRCRAASGRAARAGALPRQARAHPSQYWSRSW